MNNPAAVTLLTATEIRTLAAELDIRPTKTLGQNFVIDPNTVRRIVAASGIQAGDTVIEIGPGLGSLTLALAEAGAHVTAVEIDPKLAQRLPTTFAHHVTGTQDVTGTPHHPNEATPTLTVITADALHVTAADILEHVPHGAPTALVANLPYNVAVPVLLHMLRILPSLHTTLVMVQAEVADRLAAQPGNRTYGVPSVKAGFYGTVTRAGSIGSTVFWPAPNVDSGLVRITAHGDNAPWDPHDTTLNDAVWAITEAAFAQRRKTLRTALKSWAGSTQEAEKLLTAAGIDPTLRGEKLSTADYVRLARHTLNTR